MKINIEPTWKQALESEFEKSYFVNLAMFLKTEKALGKIIYPAGGEIFNAFKHTAFDQVKVVILGQDPYHGAGQAHGLSFSVPDGIKPPPSLVNVFKEISKDIGLEMPKHLGNLTSWADQGVLLLNASLTVRSGEPNSHAQIGWMDFTNAVIQTISEKKEGVVFLLWGKFAQEKQIFIDQHKHLILKAAHPSPYSADKGFFGCKHFSKTNDYLVQNGKSPIDWRIH